MGLTLKRYKNTKKPLLSQIIDLIPERIMSEAIDQYQSDKYCSKYKTYDQLVSQMFGQLNKCHTYRDLALGLGVSSKLLKDLNLEQSPAKSTMSDGNKKRDWRVYEQIYYQLTKHFQDLFSKTPNYDVLKEIQGKEIKIIDATIISVCQGLFDWAKYRTAKGGIKIHTCIDEATMLPEMIHITEAKVSDRRGVDNFRYPKDTIVVDDRGYFDFSLFLQRIEDKNHFVTLMKSNTVYEVVEELELPENKDQNILKDEIIRLTGTKALETGIDKINLRRVAVYIEEVDRKTCKIKSNVLEVITNNMKWSAATISELYKRRWRVETFFRLIKQNLQVNSFMGTSENAVKSQIFISLICYFLLELMRRCISKINHCFSHFVTLIRICLLQYNRLDYIVNEIQILVRKARKQRKNKSPSKQITLGLV